MVVLIEDTRQKAGQHTTKHEAWAADGVELVRCTLPWGDYVKPYAVSVDTKKDIYELYMDITSDHVRFRRECIESRNAGCQLWILVENEDGVESLDDLCGWAESDRHLAIRKKALKRAHKDPERAKRMEGAPLAGKCGTMQERYGVRFAFCTPQEAAGRVIAILEGVEPWPPTC